MPVERLLDMWGEAIKAQGEAKVPRLAASRRLRYVIRIAFL